MSSRSLPHPPPGDRRVRHGAHLSDDRPTDPHRAGAHEHRHAHAVEERRRPDERRQAPRRSWHAYTLGHAGRQVRLGPVAFWTIVGTLVIMGAWSIMTATYFAFHDDVITGLIARQAEMQFAYEDRIAEMRAQVDRVISRQLLDQEQVEQRLEQIQRRQAALESRAAALGTLADPTVTGSVRPAARTEPAKPMPIGDTGPTRDRRSRLDSRTAPSLAMASGVDGMLGRLQSALDRVETRQTASLNALEESYDARTRRIRGALAELGLNLGKAASKNAGGPFVPYRLPSQAAAFDKQVHRVHVARAQLDRLTKTLASVPIRKPVGGEIDMSSGFGVRIDPFLGRPAMHTGLDFRGEVGDPIRATAAGTVVAAGWSGGYGRMVEVDHGLGLATRYGHLSEIDVKVGQAVKSGQIVGRLGSTGRSTGPHLHYETRVGGDAVDPEKFLRAGTRVGAL